MIGRSDEQEGSMSTAQRILSDQSIDSLPAGYTNHTLWSEVAPCDHLVQIYDSDERFLDSLTRFAADGLDSGDGVIIIATPAHRRGLSSRLRLTGHDLVAAANDGSFTLLDAGETLAKFMRGDMPDDEEFHRLARDLLVLARGNGRHVRAFGEMVALLWADEKFDATIRLEYLWDSLCKAEAFTLFCAYPKVGFLFDPQFSLDEIIAAHSHVVPA